MHTIDSKTAELLRGIKLYGDTDGASKRTMNALVKRGLVVWCGEDDDPYMQFYGLTKAGNEALTVYYVKELIREHMPENNDLQTLATNLARRLAMYVYDVSEA